MQTRIHTCIHTYMPTYMHTFIHAYTHTYIRIYIYTCIHTYIHTCIHTFIHTLRCKVVFESLGVGFGFQFKVSMQQPRCGSWFYQDGLPSKGVPSSPCWLFKSRQHACTYACVYTHTHTHTHIYIYTYTCCMCVSIYAHEEERCIDRATCAPTPHSDSALALESYGPACP